MFRSLKPGAAPRRLWLAMVAIGFIGIGEFYVCLYVMFAMWASRYAAARRPS